MPEIQQTTTTTTVYTLVNNKEFKNVVVIDFHLVQSGHRRAKGYNLMLMLFYLCSQSWNWKFQNQKKPSPILPSFLFFTLTQLKCFLVSGGQLTSLFKKKKEISWQKCPLFVIFILFFQIWGQVKTSFKKKRICLYLLCAMKTVSVPWWVHQYSCLLGKVINSTHGTIDQTITDNDTQWWNLQYNTI